MKKIASAILACLAASLVLPAVARASDDPPKAWQDVRALVVRFNDAQNSHDLDVIGALLLDSPDFTWADGPLTLRGHDAAMSQLAAMYQSATWSVLPDYGSLNIRLLSPDAADVSLPAQFKEDVANQDTLVTRSVVYERAIRTPQGWRLASVTVQPPLTSSL
ncbi:MAG TPA: nuclear transport factor 2 family protein [Candidatus Eremiobacteraceae bacterium]|nr:nuclear transport factor 2 family protein [Candidatus Eremiobacteraceae bacterium]